jgi:hypothetical protein
MPDKPSDQEKMPEFPDDEEIRRQLKSLGFDDEEEALKELELSRTPQDAVVDDGAPADEPKQKTDDEALDEQFNALRDKISRAGSTKMPDPPDWSFQRPQIPGTEKRDTSGYLGIGVGISIAYTMVGATLAGLGIGWLIDRAAGTQIFRYVGTLIGAVVGLAGAIFTVVRAQNKDGR